ncbi:MAG: hypothetical protein F6K39_21795 [Okeania sp. SIO3B3]|nr:hypothetical protein [Okeania sp. SIO3B3]
MCEVYYDFLRSEGEEVAEEIVQDLQSINVIIRDDLKVDFWQQVGKFNEVRSQKSEVIFLTGI